jgi:hypothetical protein
MKYKHQLEQIAMEYFQACIDINWNKLKPAHINWNKNDQSWPER